MQVNYYAGYYVDWYSEYYGKYYGQAVRSADRDRYSKRFIRTTGTADPSMVEEDPPTNSEASAYFDGAFPPKEQ